MRIDTLCRREVVSLRGDAGLQQAASLMREAHVGALVVTDPHETGRILGVVTDRDLAIEVLAQGIAPEQRRLGMLCDRPLVAVPADGSLHDAIAAMRRGGVRRVLVMRPDGSLVGLVSVDDVVQALAAELETLAAALRAGPVLESQRTAGGADAPAPVLYLSRAEP